MNVYRWNKTSNIMVSYRKIAFNIHIIIYMYSLLLLLKKETLSTYPRTIHI